MTGFYTWLNADRITALATFAAVIVAIAAIGVSIQLTRKDRKHQYLRERLSNAVDLMMAFEEVRAIAVQQWLATEPRATNTVSAIDEIRARAKFKAILRSSAEPLPITRGSIFRHIPFGADDPDEHAYLDSAPSIGDPETDEELDMKIRAEIVASITAIRNELDRRSTAVDRWNGRPLSDGML